MTENLFQVYASKIIYSWDQYRNIFNFFPHTGNYSFQKSSVKIQKYCFEHHCFPGPVNLIENQVSLVVLTLFNIGSDDVVHNLVFVTLFMYLHYSSSYTKSGIWCTIINIILLIGWSYFYFLLFNKKHKLFPWIWHICPISHEISSKWLRCQHKGSNF